MIEKGIDKTNSHLLIQRATIKDSGTYRCSPINTVEAEIKIHVLKGAYFSSVFILNLSILLV